jgi:NADH-quinone oxidoreductase subunit J
MRLQPKDAIEEFFMTPTPMQLIFLIGSAITLLSALLVVTRRNLVHAAFFLILTLFGVAVLFVMLEAGYLAVVQVVVYIGAIAILMIMAVMVTRNVTGNQTRTFNKNYGLAILIALLVLSGLLVALNYWPALNTTTQDVDTSTGLKALGQSLFTAEAFVIPTIVASILLLAALIGSIVIAWPGKAGEE